MATTDKESSAAGTDNRPPMLEESDFESWKIRIERYIRGKPLGKLIWKSIKNGPSPHPMITVTTGEGEQQTQVTREKTDEEFTEAENNKERLKFTLQTFLVKGSNDTSSTHSIKPRRQKRFGRMWSYSCKDLEKHAATGSQGKVVTCYNCRGQGHVAKECKEKKRAKDSQWFKDKALLMEAKEKGTILDAELKLFWQMWSVQHLMLNHWPSLPLRHLKLVHLLDRAPVSQEIHGGEQLDSDVDSVIDDHDNTIPYHQYQLNNEVESVPTDVSSVIPGEISVITILDDLRSQLEGHIKTNEEQSFANDSLKAELERYKTQDLHKSALGHHNLLYLKSAQLCRPTLYLGDIIVDLVHTPFRVYDSKETLVQAEVSRTKMLERMKDPLCKVSSKPINYAKLNSLYDTFVPQKQLSSEQVYWLPANEVASYNCNQSKPITNFGIEDNLFKEVSEYMKIFDELDKEYDQCVIDKKSLEIENKNLLIQNECLLAEYVSKDICSVVLTSDIAVPMSVEPRSNCVKEHSRNLELEAEILKMKQLLVEKEKRCSFIENKYQELELKFQKYKECFENPQVCNNSSSPELNVFFEINKLKDQLQIRLVTRGIRRLKTGTMKRS
ncbi:integrase, catalytic region, zinc finger, CCHC-type containing protein [Tanacetum coccineum]